MKAQGLRTTIYFVPELEKARNWYAKVFETDPYFDEPFYVGFNIGGYELGLHPDDGEISIGTSVMTYWGVENIIESYQFLIKNGATDLEKPNNVGGEIMVAAVRDPWGNPLGIIYNPHFELP